MSKRSSAEVEVIDLLSDTEEHEKASPQREPNNDDLSGRNKKIKTEPGALQSQRNPKANDAATSTDDVEVEVEVVTPVAPILVPASARKTNTSEEEDDDVVLVGAVNEQKLPHLRQHCPDYLFCGSVYRTRDTLPYYDYLTKYTNREYCDLCYCFACDAPANKCHFWYSKYSDDMDYNHCCATAEERAWTVERDRAIKHRQLEEDIERAMVSERQPNASTSTVSAPRNRLAPTTSQDRKTVNTGTAVAWLHPLLTNGTYHLRENCHKKFQNATPDGKRQLAFGAIATNNSCCEKCFCFVCDKPAKDCKQWRLIGKKGMKSNHCCATQTEPLWVTERQVCNPGKAFLSPRNKNTNTSNASEQSQVPPPPLNHVSGSGPFAPDHEVAARDVTLTKCRKCGWYNRFPHKNFTLHTSKHGSADDWCMKCGRVASEKAFCKAQSGPYTPKSSDVFLGEKTIPFRLKAHDPRVMELFRQSWIVQSVFAEGEGKEKWMYSQAEMEEDLFRHRFGERPTLETLVASIPILREDKIPKDYIDKGNKGSIFETVAMIVEQQSHRVLLQILKDFEDCDLDLMIDISAQWNSTARTGTLKIRLFLPKDSLCWDRPRLYAAGRKTASYRNLLGNFYDIYPFALAEVSGLIKAYVHGDDDCYYKQDLPCPPFKLSYLDRRGKLELIEPTMKESVLALNEKAEDFRNGLTLLSGSGSTITGGVCLDDTTLRGCLQRFATETLAEEIFPAIQDLARRKYTPITYSDGQLRGNRHVKTNDLWLEQQMGIVSHHRSMKGGPSHAFNGDYDPLCCLESFLRFEDIPLAVTNMQVSVRQIVEKTTSMNGILEMLENLGHKGVTYVDGLNVELLEFQRQALQWALEREWTPGGIQSYWWAKLPQMGNANQPEVYFNPITETFRMEQPNLVRGGFLAAEMGLGKTVLSLGLILCNPAPSLPVSGSDVSVLSSRGHGSESREGQESGWDKDLYSRTSATCVKRGSILSRGTLVVCPVSLVGQWIEEAKSKLKDPGLIYPYHGQGRKRDPLTLAKNAIVVTTYQVLASDATYHAKKSGNANYVPPLEHVRWWRVILDESHSLKQQNTQRSAAVMRLVADHKWMVSGTPVNTTFNDLQNQLSFLGVEDVENIMKAFKWGAYVHTGDPSKSGHISKPSFGNFLFFLRSIFIRYTQTQKYRGTSTTLMSLPPKTERTLEIDFTLEEKVRYSELEDAARSFYVDFKARNGGQLTSNYLMLTQKLNQTRIACSGGRYPLVAFEELDETAIGDDGEEKRKKGKETQYSDFAFSTKLNVLITELERIRDEDPTSKSLVFSQYNSTLQWLQEELPKHGFQFRTLSGSMSMAKRAKALSDFQKDPPTTIFLLSMRAGAVGINLTQANRVFLMEPSFNPALEKQAIGRVHRLGQKRSVVVTRLVMKDSVEKRLLKVVSRRCTNASDDSEETEGDKKPKIFGGPVLVGSIQTDRAKLLGEEFDILFGTLSSPAGPTSMEI